MKSKERDETRRLADQTLAAHAGAARVRSGFDPTCICADCRTSRAVLAFVPPGDVKAPDNFSGGYTIKPCKAGRADRAGFLLTGSLDNFPIGIDDLATMRALGLYLVAYATEHASGVAK